MPTTHKFPLQDVPDKPWHIMTREELLEREKHVLEKKKNARRKVREFEDEFHALTGRRAMKEDRLPMERVYQAKRTSKSTIKLINALLHKGGDYPLQPVDR